LYFLLTLHACGQVIGLMHTIVEALPMQAVVLHDAGIGAVLW
jgi:hypothetical protein